MQYLSSWISLAFCHYPPSCRRHDQDMRTREGQRSAPLAQCCVCVYKSTKCDVHVLCVYISLYKCKVYICTDYVQNVCSCLYVLPSGKLVTCEIQICS